MESLYLLIPLSALAVVVAAIIFFRMNAGGQFEDDQGPAWSVLLDDDSVSQPTDAAPENQPPPDHSST
ncbi:MAG: cbb3-type cytochrome oxidase assembly protein CcoS [Granulosicoccus sp.]